MAVITWLPQQGISSVAITCSPLQASLQGSIKNRSEPNFLAEAASCVVLHIPHASTYIPAEYRQGILLDNNELQDELVTVTDAFCDELYDFPVAEKIIAPVSRLVCDMERFREDEKEPCAKHGQGLMYTHTKDGRVLRKYNSALREQILKNLYDPHHARLTAAVDKALEQHGKCLIIDCHSFSDDTYMPDFCIGTDTFHTPIELTKMLFTKIDKLGYSVLENIPYSGTITPMKHYGRDKRVVSVMIETNRRLYQTVDKPEKSRL